MSRDIKKYYGVSKKKRMVNMLIALLAIVSVLIILFTVYGQNVGNFVITVDTEVQRSISLSGTSNFARPTSRLTAPGVINLTHATLKDIPEDIENGEGSKNDNEKKRYFAYSFYIKNTSSMLLSYTTEIVFNHVTRGADSALRVMLIKDGKREIYAKAKEYPEWERGKPEDHIRPEGHIGSWIQEPYMTTPFLSSVTIASFDTLDMEAGGVNKYTIVMWLEGWDHECTDDIKGALIRMEMNFTTYH